MGRTGTGNPWPTLRATMLSIVMMVPGAPALAVGSFFFDTVAEMERACAAYETSPRTFPNAHCPRKVSELLATQLTRRDASACRARWNRLDEGLGRTERMEADRKRFLDWVASYPEARPLHPLQAAPHFIFWRVGCDLTGLQLGVNEVAVAEDRVEAFARAFESEAASRVEPYGDAVVADLMAVWKRDYPTLTHAQLDEIEAVVRDEAARRNNVSAGSIAELMLDHFGEDAFVEEQTWQAFRSRNVLELNTIEERLLRRWRNSTWRWSKVKVYDLLAGYGLR